MHNFKLLIDPSQIKRLASRYETENNGGVEDRAFAAGATIRGGDFSRKHLIAIIEWKIQDGRYQSRILELFAKNSDIDIFKVLSFAVKTKTEKYAIDQLGWSTSKLNGVGVPIASAIMTTIFPEVYTVVDWRVVTELCQVNQKEAEKLATDLEFYPPYLAACRGFAGQCGVSLRDFDRAMWQLSSDKGNQHKCL